MEFVQCVLLQSLLHFLRRIRIIWYECVNTYLLHFIKIMGLYPHNFLAESFLNLFHLQPRLLIVYEVDRNALSAKATGSS